MRRFSFVIATMLLFVACGRHSDQKKPPLTFGTMRFDSTWLYPLADGTALVEITDARGSVFFLSSRDQSTAIEGLPKDAGEPEVYPLAAGGAYLHYSAEEGRSALYFVEGAKAHPVRETPNLALRLDQPPLSGFAWAARAAEETRARHRRYLEEKDDEAEAAAQEDDYRL